ncbi:hypothetical protein GYMLUDRAFT_115449, partial [Collybiopsis luxurians FD-317 M1]
QKGLQSTTRRVMLAVTLYMFTISSIHWISSIADLIQHFQEWMADAEGSVGPPGVSYREVFSAVVLTNYFLTDAVVVWRAWVLCNDDNRASRLALRMTVILLFFLACTYQQKRLTSARLRFCLVSVTATIVIRILLTVPSQTLKSRGAILNHAINISQTANLGLSVLANVSAILIITAKAWRHRRVINRNLSTSTQGRQFFFKGGRILLVLIESGVIYCVSITALVTLFIRIEFGTVGDLYTLVNFQIAGIYPILVLLVVNKDYSMDKTIF